MKKILSFLPAIWSRICLGTVLLLGTAQVQAQCGESTARVKVYLEGAWDNSTGEMTTLLNSKGILAEQFGYMGKHAYTMIAGVTPPADAVDVIRIHLRETASGCIVHSELVWLLKDGSILDFRTATRDFVTFPEAGCVPAYYIIAEHRNHLPLMSRNPVPMSAVPGATFDFTDPANLFDADLTDSYHNATDLGGGQYGMIAGESYNVDNETNASDLFITSIYVNNYVAGNDVYVQGDHNLDGVADLVDYATAQAANNNLWYTDIPNFHGSQSISGKHFVCGNTALEYMIPSIEYDETNAPVTYTWTVSTLGNAASIFQTMSSSQVGIPTEAAEIYFPAGYGEAIVKVVYTDEAGCDRTETFDVYELRVDAGPDQSITTPACATLNATYFGAESVTYAWSTGENTASITVCPNVTTTYTVTVTAPNTCTATDAVVVTAIGKPLNGAPVRLCHTNPHTGNAVTIMVPQQLVASHLAHGDQLGSCQSQRLAFTDEVVTFAAEISPNPSATPARLVWEGAAAASLHLQICDAQGRRVLDRELDADAGSFTLPDDLSTGFYLVRLRDGESLHSLPWVKSY